MDHIHLVKLAKQGDKEALLQLIIGKKDEYYRLALVYTGNSHDAMDAMEDMIITLYEKIDQLKKEEAFYSWSKTILVNACKQMHRKGNKVILVDDWSEHIKEDAFKNENPYINCEQQMDLKELFNHVNEQQKEAIQLKYFHDLDYQTIATMTKVSVGTVKSRIFQGLKKLREQLGGDQNE